MGSFSSGFQGSLTGPWGTTCPFATIFAGFQRRVTGYRVGFGAFFFHERLAFTGS
jgi:hypothetical protein